jgi:hypothetical protein
MPYLQPLTTNPIPYMQFPPPPPTIYPICPPPYRSLHLFLEEPHVQVHNLPNAQVSSSQPAAHKEATAAPVAGQQALKVVKVGTTIAAIS